MRISLILFFLALFITAGCSRKIANVNSSGKTIICFGDSITYGVGASRGEDYPSVLSRMLKRKVINAGVSGDTTKGALLRLKRDVLSRDPYLVIIELGGNDFLKNIPLKETAGNLEKIVTLIQNKGAIAVICDTSVGYFMKGYREHFRSIALKKKAVFIPGVMDNIFNNPGLKSDYVHPDAKGYRIIARRIYQAVKSYVH